MFLAAGDAGRLARDSPRAEAVILRHQKGLREEEEAVSEPVHMGRAERGNVITEGDRSVWWGGDVGHDGSDDGRDNIWEMTATRDGRGSF